MTSLTEIHNQAFTLLWTPSTNTACHTSSPCIDPLLIVVFLCSSVLNWAVNLAPCWVTVNARNTQRKTQLHCTKMQNIVQIIIISQWHNRVTVILQSVSWNMQPILYINRDFCWTRSRQKWWNMHVFWWLKKREAEPFVLDTSKHIFMHLCMFNVHMQAINTQRETSHQVPTLNGSTSETSFVSVPAAVRYTERRNLPFVCLFVYFWITRLMDTRATALNITVHLHAIFTSVLLLSPAVLWLPHFTAHKYKLSPALKQKEGETSYQGIQRHLCVPVSLSWCQFCCLTTKYPAGC